MNDVFHAIMQALPAVVDDREMNPLNDAPAFGGLLFDL